MSAITRNLCRDEIFIEDLDGNRTGPIRASVQSDLVLIFEKQAVLQAGWKILRSLPNGMSEVRTISQVDFFEGPRGGSQLTHYEAKTHREGAQVPTPSKTTITINNSQGVIIGDGNVQSIVASLESLIKGIESAPGSAEQKAEARGKLIDFLAHPLTTGVLGAAATKLIGVLAGS